MRKRWLFSFLERENFSFYYGKVRGLTLKGEITMMKAIKNFMNKQWTWGTYFKLCGVVAGVYCALIGGIVAWEKWKERKELKKIQKANQEEYEF